MNRIQAATQSLWFKQSGNLIDYSCNWLSTDYNILSWALSSLQLSRFFPKLQLVTDNIGAELAVKLCLPYNSIITDLEIRKQRNFLWVSNKIYTYSIQESPFIHVDTDAYFFNEIDERILYSPLVGQNFEYNHDNYIHAYHDVITHCSYIPECVRKDSLGRVTAVNAGVIGGNNIEFFKEFAAFVTDFIQQNEVELAKCHYAHLNVFVEQFLYKKYSEFKNIPIEYVSPIEFGPPCDYKMSEFTQLPTQCNYIHITNYKRNPTVCEQMAQRLWLESPELYEHVLTVCRELKATFYPISQVAVPEQKQKPFYRTSYIFGSDNPLTIPVNSTDALSTFISILPEGKPRNVLNDVFQYELRRREFIEALPSSAVLKQHWHSYSMQVNALLVLPVEEYSQKYIRQSAYSQRIESEWNWAEINEFALQTADWDLADNLQMEPAYYEVVLYIYLHQGLVREHLLDAVNMLILDAVEEPVTIASAISAVCAQVLAYQSEVNQQELANTVMSRIRHFLYHGVLEVVA